MGRVAPITSLPTREALPDNRPSVTHKARIETGQGRLSVYFIAGFYEDGRVGEVFISAGKVGGTLTGILNDLARLMSFALQYGVPLEELCERMAGSNYPPQGTVINKELIETKDGPLAVCSSVTDYLFRWLPTVVKEEAE